MAADQHHKSALMKGVLCDIFLAQGNQPGIVDRTDCYFLDLEYVQSPIAPTHALSYLETQVRSSPHHHLLKAYTSHNLLTSSCDGGGRSGGGMFRSYFEPPGADGGLYGSGCFHFSRSFSVSVNNSCIAR